VVETVQTDLATYINILCIIKNTKHNIIIS